MSLKINRGLENVSFDRFIFASKRENACFTPGLYIIQIDWIVILYKLD